jgi:acetoin utilization deacetylase AcuC-like enzyme
MDARNCPVTLYYCPAYRLDWEGHVFPVEKYELVVQRLRERFPHLHPCFREAPPASRDQLLLVHTEEYLTRGERLASNPALAYLEFEMPLSHKVIQALHRMTGGSIMACHDAVETGRASVNLGGGFHHAFADHGEGFCFINDVAVAVRVAQKEGWIRRAAIIDCDLHQGNGTARIFQGDDTVFTFSIHQENNYPVKQKSDWDIGLEDFAGDERYLEELAQAVPRILDEFRPDLVLYLAGADPYEEDLLGALRLSKEGLRKRDRLVFQACRERRIPVAVTLAGGYARQTEDVVEIHVNMVEELLHTFRDAPPPG